MARLQRNVDLPAKLELHYKAQIQAMKTFHDALVCRDTVVFVQKEEKAFHDILADAERRGYIHYTRLAAVMGLKDSSTVSRWFKGKVVPDRFRRVFALLALEKVVANDIRRMESDDSQGPIGHKSMKEFPELEIEVVDLVA